MLTQTIPQRVMRRVEMHGRERETPGRCSETSSRASGCIAIRLTTDQKIGGSNPSGRAHETPAQEAVACIGCCGRTPRFGPDSARSVCCSGS